MAPRRYLKVMKKSELSYLRMLIEMMVVDKMRLPRGPNSRDDAEDRDLDDPMDVEKQNVEVTER